MYLKEINLNNYRKFTNLKCDFTSGMNIIVGPNDSGKTAIIDAIRLVFRQVVDDYVKITELDYNNTQPIEIFGTFSFDDVDGNEQDEEASAFVEYLSFDKDNKPILNFYYEINVSNKHPSLTFGASKEISVEMDILCKELLRVIYLKPLRDASIDISARKGSRFSNILKNISIISDKESDIKKSYKQFFDDLMKVISSANVDSDLNDIIKDFSDITSNVSFGGGDYLGIQTALEKISLSLEQTKNPGLGTQNILVIVSELLHLKYATIPKIILIEEIEAHLHPQRQYNIISQLRELSSKDKFQVIITTHSPNITSSSSVIDLRLCTNNNYYSLAEGHTKLDSNDKKFLNRFLDTTKSDMFFASGVILVEGFTEQVLIDQFAYLINLNNRKKMVSVVVLNGLSFERYVNVFKRINNYNSIPISIITDADKKNNHKIKTYIDSASDSNNNIKCFVGDAHVVENKSNTIEKVIFSKTKILRQLYIDSYNELKSRLKLMDNNIDAEDAYGMLEHEKAPVAQLVAIKITELDNDNKMKLSEEIEINLKYIIEGIKHAHGI